MMAAAATKTLDLELAKKSLLYLSGAALLLIPIDALWVSFEKPKALRTDKPAPAAAAVKLEPEDSYLKVFERSTLFGSGTVNGSAPAMQTSLAELIKDYRLKGVVLTTDPEAIVEDARTQKTLFIKKGEMLGELTVKEIGEGFVVFSYLDGETKLEIQ